MSSVIKTKAIVVNNRRYGESDLVVTLLTEDHGMVSGLARGAMRSRKRFAGSLEPFTLVELQCVLKPEGLARLDGADIVNPHRGLMADLDRINAASCLMELATLVEPPATERGEAFRTAAAGLRALEEYGRPFELLAVYMLRYLAVAGFSVHTGTCSACGGRMTGGGASYRGGEGLVCAKCAGTGAMALSPGLTAFIRSAQAVEESKAARLRLTPSGLREFNRFMGPYLRAVAGRELRSFLLVSSASFA